ncbi:hypothetical protein [Lentzea guizhouensis]|uniref:hypothetical protein n=1 Tax=Lentzea guizhouensis TaxID=1586287 RepID=UPI0012B69D1B|nr:hypothetical protein [Lentzea guizhouensis]
MKHRTRSRTARTPLRALWRWIVSYDSRERLGFVVEEILSTNRLNATAFNAASNDTAQYMKMVRTGKGNEAATLYLHIRDTYPSTVRNLALCATLLRHGLLTGRLVARDYDLIQRKCGHINGGAKLRPFFSKIDRVSRSMQ